MNYNDSVLKMFKFTAVVLLLVGSCLAESPLSDEIKQLDETEKFDGTQYFDEAKAELDETNEELDKGMHELNENQESIDEIDQEFDQKSVDENDQEFDQKSLDEEFDQKSVDEIDQEFDQKSVDENDQEFDQKSLDEEFDENEESDETAADQESDEIEERDESQGKAAFDEAVEMNVRYLDTAREALLKFARDLRKGKNVTNSFLKVIDGFEKKIADFQATLGRRRIDPSSVDTVKKFIEEASKNKKANTMILRTLAAQGVFLAQKSKAGSTRFKRDNSLIEGATAFLESIKEDIGEESFKEFLGVSGQVTLIFVIDDTGSMGDEIDAVVQIAKNIVRRKREVKVDYILSPFNDPSK